MDIREIKNLIAQAFTKDGVEFKGYMIKCVSPMSAVFHVNGDAMKLEFTSNRPVFSVTKIITFSVELEELYITDDGGTIKLKHFPDINFTFDDDGNAERTFGCEGCSTQALTGQTDLYDEINAKFGDAESRRLASRALSYAESWATVALDSGECFANASPSTVRQMKKECRAFVADQMKEERSGSVLVILLVNFLLPYIIKWIVERVIDNLINS
jgi:hypothetical protein